jgi:hypothetical protein
MNPSQNYKQKQKSGMKTTRLVFYLLGFYLVFVILSLNKATKEIPSGKNKELALIISLPRPIANKSKSSCKIPRLQTDLYCPGCRTLTHGRPKVSCLALINQLNKRAKKAGMNVSSEDIPNVCQRCMPNACSAADKISRRFDEAAPQILLAASFHLKSIPEQYRIPPDLSNGSEEMTKYFSNPNNTYPVREYFSEINPSLVRIPSGQIPKHLLHDGVVYLASFRVTNLQNCVTGVEDRNRLFGAKNASEFPGWPSSSRSYLGLALLRDDLSVVADVTVGPFFLFRLQRGPMEFRMEDFRLFVTQDQIYVSSFTNIVPLWLEVPAVNARRWRVLTADKDAFQVSMRLYASCVFTADGKNFMYFHDDVSNETVVELYPMFKKISVDLSTPCNKHQKKSDLPDLAENGSVANFPSFGAVDELFYAKYGMHESALTAERGSACCAPIHYEGRNLWLGVTHSKTKRKKAGGLLFGKLRSSLYFSTFYVFEQSKPYSVVAWSGRFCLGFPSEKETRQNPYARLNMVPLYFEDTFDCPAIHFVSGIVEDALDNSKVIIAYGVNDCASRMVKVEKAEILRMLFPSMRSNETAKLISSPRADGGSMIGVDKMHFDCTLA